MTTLVISMALRSNIVVVILVIMGLTYLAQNPVSQAQSGIDVYTIDSKPYDVTYGNWTAKWWQWALSIPSNVNPAGDNTGEYCGQKQSGPVWFLAGTFGGSAERKCTIPEGKAIFFSPINAECSFTEYQNIKDESGLRECAKAVQDAVDQMAVSVDGIKLENLVKYRIQSPIFEVELPEDNIFGIPATKTQAVSDGNWVFLKPLSKGEHIIKSSGHSGKVVTPQVQMGAFTSEVTYHLIIK